MVTVQQSELAKGLATVSKAVATRTTLPILGNIHVRTTEDGRLRLAATNLSLSMVVYIGANVQEPLDTTVPAKTLVDLVNTLPSGAVELSLMVKTQTMRVKAGKFTSNIKCVDSEEYPAISESGNGASLELDASTLSGIIKRVAFSAATDESRPVLTAVLFKSESGLATFAAADGFRLSVDTLPTKSNFAPTLIPAKALQELERAMGSDPVVLSVSESQFFAQTGNLTVVSQLVDGSFPTYEQIIPQESSVEVTVNRQDLASALKAAKVFARESAQQVRLSVSQGLLKVVAVSAETGDNAGELTAVLHGEPMDIAFNIQYLTDALNAFTDSEVTLQLQDSGKPCLLESGTFQHIIMPMHLQ